MKRILLANFAECPENLHFEKALIRALAHRRGTSLDIIHDFDYHYGFIGPETPAGGRRSKYSGLSALKQSFRGPYDLLVLLDFPKRARCSSAFLWLLREAGARSKVYVANHLIPMPGDSSAADLSRRFRALGALDAGYMLEFDDRGLWSETGLTAGRLRTRGYAADCSYYRPRPWKRGDYVFSAGSAGRGFAELARGAARSGLRLKIYSDSKPGRLPRGTEHLPLMKNLHNLKDAVAGAAAVVIPVKDRHVNEAAGNSIAFLSMALGRPVLTKRTPYMERFIRDGVNGFLYDSLTPASVAAGLSRVKAMSDARLKKMGASARRTMLAKASLDRFCAEFLKKHL